MKARTLIFSTTVAFLFVFLLACQERVMQSRAGDSQNTFNGAPQTLSLYYTVAQSKILSSYNEGFQRRILQFREQYGRKAVLGCVECEENASVLFIDYGPSRQQLDGNSRWKDWESIKHSRFGVLGGRNSLADKYKSITYTLQKNHVKAFYSDMEIPCNVEFSQLVRLINSSSFVSLKRCENLAVRISNDNDFTTEFQIGHRYILADNKNWTICYIHLSLPIVLEDSLIKACMLSALDISETVTTGSSDNAFSIAIKRSRNNNSSRQIMGN